ncbi:MAG TPA: response regulator [Thermoanaerobaculia bacterium]|jgi:CheY-like chemotaxis protein|nr:response regulator [Thermoanaerobaculia bacterium]
MSRRILLADDSVTIQKVIELTFMDEDFEVSAVSNGDEAVRLLPELRPELVIADVHMPGANGYEVCRRAKALDPRVPVLLLVGTFEPFDEGQARSAGSDAFLKKPFDSQELLQIVQGLLDKAGHGALPPAAEPAPALAALTTPPEPEAEAPWASFELEPEPPPAPAASTPATAGFAWSSPSFTPEVASPADEQLFELEPAEDLALDESFLPAEEPFFLEAGGLGATEFAEVPAPVFPAGLELPAMSARPEERVGVPLGAAPLAGSLAAVEHQIAAHAPEPEALPDLPDWASAPVAAAAPAVAPAASAAMPVGSVALRSDRLSDEDVDRIARRLVELLGDKVVRDVAWEVVPDLAEVVIKDRLRELESQVE